MSKGLLKCLSAALLNIPSSENDSCNQASYTFLPKKIKNKKKNPPCILWTTLTTNRYEQTKTICYLIEHDQFWAPQSSAVHHSNSSSKKYKVKNQFKLKLKYHLVHPDFKIVLQNKFYTQEINHHSVTRQGE